MIVLAIAIGKEGSLNPCPDVQLVEDYRQVVLHGLLTKLKAPADLLIAEPLDNQCQDPLLPSREPGQSISRDVCGCCRSGSKKLRCECRCHVSFAAVDSTYGLYQFSPAGAL